MNSGPLFRRLPSQRLTPSQSPPAAGFVLSGFWPPLSRWLSLITWVMVLLMVAPVVALLVESGAGYIGLAPHDTTFAELADTVLLTYSQNTALVVSGAVLFACALAILPAWWCAHYEFAGRRYLQWAMVFPLAIPAYISAYIYTDLLDYAGPVQQFLRQLFGWSSPQQYWFPDIRSRWGASLMLALALYPYIYLLLRHAFSQRSEHLSQAAKTLGASPRRIFFTVELPLVRPALVIGCTLVAMESLADYGTVHLFAVSTLTTAVYDSWLVYGSLTTAAKISCLMLLVVVLLISGEKYQRQKQRHYDARNSGKTPKKVPAGLQRSLIIWLVCAIIFTFGFLYPVATLIHYSLTYASENANSALWQHSQTTFLLAAIAATVATLLALSLNARQRFHPGIMARTKLAMSSLGYTLPGTVLAIGILIPLTQADLWLNRLLVSVDMERVGLIFTGTSFALITAFVIRFAAISNGSLQAGYQKIPDNIDAASFTLGENRTATFKRVHLPLLKPALVSSFLLVFIECVKELPASLLLRPFDFETLATYVFQYASDEHLEHAASGALLIIIVSLLPIAVLSRTQKMD